MPRLWRQWPWMLCAVFHLRRRGWSVTGALQYARNGAKKAERQRIGRVAGAGQTVSLTDAVRISAAMRRT